MVDYLLSEYRGSAAYTGSHRGTSRYQEDIKILSSPEGMQHEFPDGYKVNAHEIGPKAIYKDANVTVTAFPTKHAFPETYGYRFDTNPVQATIDACHGCDVLIHEAHTLAWLAKRPPHGRLRSNALLVEVQPLTPPKSASGKFDMQPGR